VTPPIAQLKMMVERFRAFNSNIKLFANMNGKKTRLY
jgi:hypothetical protein